MPNTKPSAHTSEHHIYQAHKEIEDLKNRMSRCEAEWKNISCQAYRSLVHASVMHHHQQH